MNQNDTMDKKREIQGRREQEALVYHKLRLLEINFPYWSNQDQNRAYQEIDRIFWSFNCDIKKGGDIC